MKNKKNDLKVLYESKNIDIYCELSPLVDVRGVAIPKEF